MARRIPKKVPTTRMWGGSLKYALWTMSREACVAIGQSLHTHETKRMVFKDVEELVKAGLVEVSGINVTLTTLGHRHVPEGVSHVTKYAALKVVDASDGLHFADGHAVGIGGKVSRYVAEVLLAQGYLMIDGRGRIVRNDSDSAESWRNALWTLSNERCYVADGVLKAMSDDRLVFHDANTLEINGYMDATATITPVGRRLVPKGLGYVTIKQTMAAFEASARWQFQGSWAVGENEGRLPRYNVERLIQIGKLQIDTGGYVVKAVERVWYKCHLSETEHAMISRIIKLELVK